MGALNTLILFTTSYPYEGAAEQIFIDKEIGPLVSNFDRVILVPEYLHGPRHYIPLEVEVDEGYSAFYRGHIQKLTFPYVLLSRLLWEDIVSRPTQVLPLRSLLRLCLFVWRAHLCRIWVKKFIEDKRVDPAKAVFYTYWLNHVSLGTGLAKKCHPQIKLVSRAHGYDLYEERYHPPYLPCRRAVIGFLDRLFLISRHGMDYLRKRYPGMESVCVVSRLGVNDPGFRTLPSSDGKFRIVSCSFMVPVKRLERMVTGMNRLGRLNPRQSFEWYHIGGGPLKNSLEEMACKTLPANVKYSFIGTLSNEEVLLFYRRSPIDLYVNVSESEGIPLAIMEALSCGMPVMATAVGGVQEVVSDRNGKLLSPNPSDDEIARSVLSFLDHPDLALEKRQQSRRVWKEVCDGSRNFQDFADQLRSLVRST